VAPRFEREGIGIAVVLSQSCERVAATARRQGAQYPFPVLCDHSRAVIKRYGVWHPIGIDAFNVSRPASFLIDGASRRIRYSFVGESQFERAPLARLLAATQI
jgi:peroxiredoxin